jgi:hypothetical protein
MDSQNWDEIKEFIKSQKEANAESRQYRAIDIVTQKYQVENIEKLKNQVTLQNGRVFELEKFREEIKNKIKYKEDNLQDIKDFLMIVATVVMAVSAIVVFFKK